MMFVSKLLRQVSPARFHAEPIVNQMPPAETEKQMAVMK